MSCDFGNDHLQLFGAGGNYGYAWSDWGRLRLRDLAEVFLACGMAFSFEAGAVAKPS